MNWRKLMTRLILLAVVTGLVACAKKYDEQHPPTSLDSALSDVYKNTCAMCHAIEGTGAPLTGDQDAWSEVLDQGMAKAVENAMLGTGGMPARGQCFECSPKQIELLIAYMANPKEK